MPPRGSGGPRSCRFRTRWRRAPPTAARDAGDHARGGHGPPQCPSRLAARLRHQRWRNVASVACYARALGRAKGLPRAQPESSTGIGFSTGFRSPRKPRATARMPTWARVPVYPAIPAIRYSIAASCRRAKVPNDESVGAVGIGLRDVAVLGRPAAHAAGAGVGEGAGDEHGLLGRRAFAGLDGDLHAAPVEALEPVAEAEGLEHLAAGGEGVGGDHARTPTSARSSSGDRVATSTPNAPCAGWRQAQRLIGDISATGRTMPARTIPAPATCFGDAKPVIDEGRTFVPSAQGRDASGGQRPATARPRLAPPPAR